MKQCKYMDVSELTVTVCLSSTVYSDRVVLCNSLYCEYTSLVNSHKYTCVMVNNISTSVYNSEL